MERDEGDTLHCRFFLLWYSEKQASWRFWEVGCLILHERACEGEEYVGKSCVITVCVEEMGRLLTRTKMTRLSSWRISW